MVEVEPAGRQAGKGMRQGDVARIRRGIATGFNLFFVISEARRREFGIRRSQLCPCITSPRLLAGSELRVQDLEALPDDVPPWALDCRDPDEEHRQNALGAYLRRGRRELNAHAGWAVAAAVRVLASGRLSSSRRRQSRSGRIAGADFSIRLGVLPRDFRGPAGGSSQAQTP
ncbi:MAG: hypothetical protein C4305_08685 [Thermoleophilia bacterium]